MPNNRSEAVSTRAKSNTSGMESCGISESITSIKLQLQKLDLLEQLSTDVKELKHSVEFNNSLIEVLKADNASLRSEVNNLKQLTAELQKDKINMANSILDLQCRSMRDNIVIHGLAEVENETHQKSEELLKSFLVKELKMKPEDAGAVRFSRVHRLGRTKPDQQRRPRPIVAKVVDSKMKSTVISRGKELKGSNYSISDQFPPEIMNRRRLLNPVMAEARKAKKNARLFIDKLYIDGALYRNSRITYWLTGGNENTEPQDKLSVNTAACSLPTTVNTDAGQ
ncbi:uncharacterized protein V6R79_004722 [Siganus canaliculatus]